MSEDRIFVDEKFGDEPFRFDESVARVFPDMLRRSIPGYAATLDAIGSLAARFVGAGATCFDLGCSLGAATLAMRQGIRAPGCRIVAVDNAPAMVERCRQLVIADTAAYPGRPPVEVRLGDARDTEIRDGGMVVMNFTLQFVPPAERDGMVARIADGLVPGGILFLSEKVVDEDPAMEALLVDLYHEHKRRNDYSALEVARKRAALENVLVPETVAAHRRRLAAAGFGSVAVWLRYFNFVSLIAIKPDGRRAGEEPRRTRR
ncbi:MAG TPA: carboxy-S-adenosyl-L-methionine synthase CmoA [Woeseiaceae bacterium]|nr:carboxy-S-adenosyl-L-methionine synthase CmoA [Woeseiaceae bacterium]